MSETQSSRGQVQAAASNAVQSAIRSEIESVLLGRMEATGGNLAQMARFRSFLGEALGIVGTVTDIINMAMAGYQAMTTQRRMVKRVAAAHGFGYWVFQHNINQNPINPPNSFLIMQRERDLSDQVIARRTNNDSFSSDGGLTSADWNMIWRSSVQDSTRVMQNRLMNMASRNELQRAWVARFGVSADLSRQTSESIVNLFRVAIMCPQLGSPAAAAGAFFLSSLKDATTLEKEMSLRLYRRFPCDPTVSR